MIILYELMGQGGRNYSLFSWRTRMALAHKGLAFESHPVPMSVPTSRLIGYIDRVNWSRSRLTLAIGGGTIWWR